MPLRKTRSAVTRSISWLATYDEPAVRPGIRPSCTSAAGRWTPVVDTSQVKNRVTDVRSVSKLPRLSGTITAPTSASQYPIGWRRRNTSRSLSKTRSSTIRACSDGLLGLKKLSSGSDAGFSIGGAITTASTGREPGRPRPPARPAPWGRPAPAPPPPRPAAPSPQPPARIPPAPESCPHAHASSTTPGVGCWSAVASRSAGAANTAARSGHGRVLAAPRRPVVTTRNSMDDGDIDPDRGGDRRATFEALYAGHAGPTRSWSTTRSGCPWTCTCTSA